MIKLQNPKRKIRWVWIDCDVCGEKEKCETVEITMVIGNRIASKRNTGIRCMACGIQEDAELSKEEALILFEEGASNRK